MDCEQAVEWLTGSGDERSPEDRRGAREHVMQCVDCRGAVAAVHALRMASLVSTPAPRPGAFDRAMAAVTRAQRLAASTEPARSAGDSATVPTTETGRGRGFGSARRARRGFWPGVATGAGIAAAAAIAAVGVWRAPEPAGTPATAVETPAIPGAAAETPQFAMALNEPGEVNIELTAPEAFADAEIHVVLSGAVDLEGYPGQRELRWRTNLEAGVNRLTLPVVATGEDGGQLLVDVEHGGKHRTFLVDVIARV